MQHKRIPYLAATALAAVVATMAARPAMAQLYADPALVQVAPGVFRQGPIYPGSLYPTPVQTTFVQYRASLPGPTAPAVIPAYGPSLARVDAPMRLAEISEEQIDDTVTRAYYTASGVVITIAPVGRGVPVRLVGQVEVVTETTLDADGYGTIEGLLTFTSRSRNGTVAQLISLRLTGEVSDTAGPLLAEGELNIPAATPYELPLTASISASLSSDANLTARLTGMAESTVY